MEELKAVFAQHKGAFKQSKVKMAIDGLVTLKYVMEDAMRRSNVQSGWSKPGLYPLDFGKMMAISSAFAKHCTAADWVIFQAAVEPAVALIRENGILTEEDMDRLNIPKTQGQLIAEGRKG